MRGQLLVAALTLIATAHGATFSSVIIRTGDRPGGVEMNAARILSERLSEPGGLPVRIARESDAGETPPGALVVLLGTAQSHRGIARLLDTRRPLRDPEGFTLKTVARPEGTLLVAAGVDARGVLYAVGEILRRAEVRAGGVDFPVPLDFRTAPAFEVRGTQYGQSSVAIQKGKVRRWTTKEAQRVIEDYALAGLNTMQTNPARASREMFDYIRSLGLKTLVHYGPNVGSGPPEWEGFESIGRKGYLCPSVPAARAVLLKKFEDTFRGAPFVDYICFTGGDGGGCECDRCKPYGATFIRLCEDMANIIHREHPQTQIFFTNQKFDNESDLAIFKYLQERPRTWLRAFGYGPGSDAMSWQPGHRQNHRMDLFRYPGFGPFDRYLKEILHQLPPEQDIVFYNELTHWRYSQNGYVQAYPRADKNGDQPPDWNHWIYERRPDQALTMVYDRLSFFAWPRYYHWVFGETVRYGIGDCTHSSGTQDHFNQWMWQRLLWGPQRKVEDLVAEYARAWFGPEAAPLMAQAIFQLEENLEEKPGTPIERKDGIDRYYRLVKNAGAKMPATRMRGNWLWREYMQKAALDKHIQLDVRRQRAVERRVEQRIRLALQSGATDAAITESLTMLATLPADVEMNRLRREATRLGEESNQLFGVRSEGIFNLDHDFLGLGWTHRQLERARAARGAERRELLGLIADYENPGPGGFYDNAGTANPAPHIVRGYPYDFGQPYVPEMLDEANRPSQRSMHFTQDEDQGVTFHYRDLDPKASYRIRFTLVRPRYQERYRERMNQKSETIYADQFVLAKDLAVPERVSDFFTFDIPPEATRDGELVVRFERAADVAHGSRVEREVWRNTGGWGTIVSEAWLMRKTR
jgi:hypothetical protein